MTNFAVWYSVQNITTITYQLNRSLNHHLDNERAKTIIREYVPYGADFLIGLLWLVVSQDCV